MESGFNIGMSIDDNYLWPWMVTVYSGVINCEGAFPKLILANPNNLLSLENQKFARDFANILEIDLEILKLDIEADLKFEHHFNETIYSRILMMDILSNDFLWLDSDLVLMTGWNSIFQEKGDCQDDDVVIRGVLDTVLYRERLTASGNGAILRSEGRYLNSGVLLMSPTNWKKIDAPSLWLEMAQNPGNYGIAPNDQDILNFLCAGRSSVLPPKYNYIVGDEYSSTDHNLIQHFAGPPKPWKLSKTTKEFFLSVQGFNYFKPQNWNTFYADTFLYYPKYWKLELELSELLHRADTNVLKAVNELRDKNVLSMDFASRLKYLGLSFFSRKWR